MLLNSVCREYSHGDRTRFEAWSHLAGSAPSGYYDRFVEADSPRERRGRGRPPVFPEDLYVEGTSPREPLTRRQQQNRLYAKKALEKIDKRCGHDERVSYLYGSRGPRWGILAELGRCLDGVEGTEREGEFWQAVFWLLNEQPRAKEAEAKIRRMRIGRAPQAQTVRLADELAKAIDSYRRRHPDLSRAQELTALRTLAAVAERRARAEGGFKRDSGPGPTGR